MLESNDIKNEIEKIINSIATLVLLPRNQRIKENSRLRRVISRLSLAKTTSEFCVIKKKRENLKKNVKYLI
jgi:hypothetical protein